MSILDETLFCGPTAVVCQHGTLDWFQNVTPPVGAPEENSSKSVLQKNWHCCKVCKRLGWLYMCTEVLGVAAALGLTAQCANRARKATHQALRKQAV